MVTGWVQLCWSLATMWSCRCSPTPGRSVTTGMPSAPSSAALPMPESCSSCGELNAPLASTTRPAFTSTRLRARSS